MLSELRATYDSKFRSNKHYFGSANYTTESKLEVGDNSGTTESLLEGAPNRVIRRLLGREMARTAGNLRADDERESLDISPRPPNVCVKCDMEF